MDKRIGVGMIVGLVIASSMFVYESGKFSKTQKIILLIFALFAPLQWASILILLIIDYYKTQNSIQNVARRKNQAETANYEGKINTLRELKNKELLTEEEYNQKANTLKNSIAETELKQSEDYKKLKSLFDANLLTKEEFEQKLDLLSKRPTVQRPTSKVEEPINYAYRRMILYTTLLIVGIIIYLLNVFVF